MYVCFLISRPPPRSTRPDTLFPYTTLFRSMIDRFGAQAVKDKYLPSLIPMEQIASYCLTEAGAGSDAGSLKTKAVRDGNDYIVTGSKQFISGDRKSTRLNSSH